MVGCDSLGHVDAAEVIDSIGPDSALVHLQWGNHEVGTLGMAEVVTACRDRGVLAHVDAAQAAGHLPVAFTDLGADLMSVSAHKMGGPPGAGTGAPRGCAALAARGRRPGAGPAPAWRTPRPIVGWGAAAEADGCGPRRGAGRQPSPDRARPGRRPEPSGRHGLRRPGRAAGPHRLPRHRGHRAPGAGAARARPGRHRSPSGSACASEDLMPSPVLEAMGVDAHHSLRIGTGWSTTDADVDVRLGGAARRARPPAGSRSVVAPVALLPEGVAVDVVAVALPEARLVTGTQLEGPHPLGRLPEVEVRMTRRTGPPWMGSMGSPSKA